MHISVGYTIQESYFGANKTLNKANSSTSIKEKKNTDQVDNNSEDIWQKLAKKYNIRNATFDELCDMSKKLYEAGQISLFHHAILTFNPSKSPQPIKPNRCLTGADDDGKRDWIAEYEARAAKDLKVGNMMGYMVNKDIIRILERLQ